jgi:hypothetical protein
MAAGAYTIYDSFKAYLGNNTINGWSVSGTNPLKIALVTSTYTPASTHTVYADLTNEVSNANGYTTGGAAVASQTVESVPPGAGTDYSVGATTWTASGTGIVARRGVLYVNATVNSVVKPLVGYFLLDAAPADVTTSAGNSLTINGHVVFTMT